MKNNFEYKVVCWNKCALYIAKTCRGYGRAFAYKKEDTVIAFASYAVNLLSERFPEAVLDGLVRVDIFITAENKMVVNEFESLEADFFGADHTLNSAMEQRMRNYWREIVSNQLTI
jgi:hypothetical protein